jgi:radical SAM-linked protein
VSEVKQRWRIVFARGDEARFLSHLDAVRSWERAFRRSEIPVATSEGFSPRSKLVFAAPLQLGMLAEHELADLYLAERLTAPDLRARLVESMPRGYTVVDLHDVWSGAPALAPRLVAADYRMTLLNVEPTRLQSAVERLMAAQELPRERRKESRVVRYDLRPLLLDLRAGPPDAQALPPAGAEAGAAVVGAAGCDAGAAAGTAAVAAAGAGAAAGTVTAAGLWMRLRHSQNLGSGRPDEVVAALAAELGMRPLPAAGTGDDGESAEGSSGAGSSGAVEAQSGESAAGPSAGTGPPAAASPAVAAPQPQLETIRPVRERLWLDDELA